jgi:hypothetical protein
VYIWLSAFNFNIDVTAPECAIPNLGFSTKWLFIEGLPLAALTMFTLCHVLLYVKKRFLLGRKRKLHSHLPALVGTSLVMMYYLYLNLTRSVLDIFNCQPTQPDTDGKTYLRTIHSLLPCVHASALRVCVRALLLFVQRSSLKNVVSLVACNSCSCRTRFAACLCTLWATRLL